MYKNKKRAVAFLMALIICVSTVLPVFTAMANGVTDDEKAAVETRCKALQEKLLENKAGEFGLLSKLRYLTEYQMYVKFISDNRLGFQEEEVRVYTDSLRAQILSFNRKYSKGPKKNKNKYKKLKLANTASGKSPKEAITKNLCITIPDYLDKILSEIQREVNSKNTDAEKQSTMEKNGTAIKMCFEIMQTYEDTANELTNQSALSGSGGKKKTFSIDDSKNNETASVRLGELFEKYSDLLSYGEELSSQYNSSGNIADIDLTKSVLEIFSNAKLDENGELVFTGEPELNATYMALIAGSSVYRPFESYVGSEEFLAAVSYLCEDANNAANLCSVYNSTKDFRKPLYRRELNDSGEPVGIARIITLEDFLKAVESGESFALVTIDGKFRLNKDTQTWVYSTEKEDESGNSSESETSQDDEIESLDMPSVFVDPEENAEQPANAESEDDQPADAESEDERHEDASPRAFSNDSAALSDWHVIYREHNRIQVSTNGNGTSNNPSTESMMSTFDAAIESEEENNGSIEDETENTSSGVYSDENYDTAYKNAKSETTIDAYEEITDISKMSDPILIIGSGSMRYVDNMTAAILTNIINNTNNIEGISDKATRFVYTNPYGDIVLDDNLVILPGISNPIIWGENAAYVPYTAAVMNNYPTVLYNASYFKLYNSSDIGRYLFFSSSSSAQSLLSDKEIDYTGFALYQAQSLDSFGSKQLQSMNLNLDFELQDGSGDTIKLLRPKTFLYSAGTAFMPKDEAPLVRISNELVNNTYVFPYDVSVDSGFSLAKLISGNMYNKLTKDSRTEESKNQGLLNDNYIIQNILKRQLDGTSNPTAYSDNALLQYDSFVRNTPERISKNISSFANSIIDSIGSIDGIIGIKNSYNLGILGDIFNVLRQNIWLLLLIITIIVVFCFIRNNHSFGTSLIVGLISIGVTYLFVIVVPVYLPYIFNSITNNVSQELAFEALGTQIEKESSEASVKNALDQDGNIVLTASSLSLYRYPFYSLDKLCENLALDSTDEITGGDTHVINEDSGMYAQDDTIKVSLANLMGTLKISGEYSPAADGRIYKLKSYKTTSNNVDYYTPYYQIVDGFLEKINALISIYDIPRTTSAYVNGIQKDNFAVKCYLTSAPFLTPGMYGSMIDYEMEKAAGLTDEEIQEYVDEDHELELLLSDVYGANDDWLGIAGVIEAPTLAANTDVRGTLWATQLQAQGYYTENWEMNVSKCAHLIKYINNVTKKFILDTEAMMNELSDDTLIKLISLRALLALNQKASDDIRKMYPLFVNYDDFNLKSIMTAIFTDDFQSFLNMDMDVANYVKDEYGILSLILFVITMIEIVIFSFVVRFLFPVIYVAFGLLILCKMFSNKNIHPLVKGYFKFTLCVFIEFSAFCFGLVITRKLRGSFIGILFLFIVISVLLWLLQRLLLSWFADKTNLGNSALNVNMVNSFKGFWNRNVSRMRVEEAYLNNRTPGGAADAVEFEDGLNAYASDRSVDDLYSSGSIVDTYDLSDTDYGDEGGDYR